MTSHSKDVLESALRELEAERHELERQIGAIKTLLRPGRTLHAVKTERGGRGRMRRQVSDLTRRRQSEAAKARWARQRGALKAA
jgi:hypothetical protein